LTSYASAGMTTLFLNNDVKTAGNYGTANSIQRGISMTEVLTRLAPKSAQMIRMPGESDLTVADIAAACAGANQTGLNILLAKVVGDRSAHKPLFYAIYRQITEIAIKEKWKFRRGEERIRSLVNLALYEYVGEPRCPACKGTRYTQQTKCRTCGGSGYMRLDDKQRAIALGIHPSVWLRVWKDRYARVFQVLSYHESDAVVSLYRRLT